MNIENINLLRHVSSAGFPIVTRKIANVPMIMLTLGIRWVFPEIDLYSHSVWRCVASKTIGWISLTSPILGLGASLLADVRVFAASAIGSLNCLKIGIIGVDQAIAYSPAKRAIFGSVGIAGLASAADGLKNIALGFATYRSLDPEQQYFILKHRSIENLAGQEKNCRAVIIDGTSSKWGTILDDHSSSLAEDIYRKCDVRTYRSDPDSNTPVCHAAKKGKEAVGGPVDILAILGHANETHIMLKDHTYFTGESYETSCLREHLQPDAQMILAGCETTAGNNSLAKKV